MFKKNHEIESIKGIISCHDLLVVSIMWPGDYVTMFSKKSILNIFEVLRVLQYQPMSVVSNVFFPKSFLFYISNGFHHNWAKKEIFGEFGKFYPFWVKILRMVNFTTFGGNFCHFTWHHIMWLVLLDANNLKHIFFG